MATDLTDANDHPAVLLEGPDAPQGEALNSFMDNELDKIADSCFHYGVGAAADYLREYEKQHGVTFVALDNDTLARVREANATLGRDDLKSWDDEYQRAEDEFIGTVRDLLGLGD